jgi:AcrR family transcriptional regulator
MLAPDTAQARDRLIDAAEAVIVRDGVANLTLDAVAKEAGVSKGGLLYHFPSKSALTMAIVERLATRCEANQARALQAEPASPGAFTRAYLHARLESALEPDEAPLHTALLAAAGEDPRYLEPFRQRAVEWQRRLEQDGIDPVTANIVRLAVQGLALGELFKIPVAEGEMRHKVIERLLEMTRTPQTK